MALATRTRTVYVSHGMVNSFDALLDDEQHFQNDDDRRNTEELYADFNNLESISDRISLFARLRILDLSNNKITEISRNICELRMLDTLILKNNLITADRLPKNFNLLTQLRELNLSGNKLRYIPRQIYQLTGLITLQLGANEIELVEPCIQNLHALETLYMGGNKLFTLPEEIGNLRALSCLVLSDNKLEFLPTSISRLAALQSLSLHGNCLNTLPIEILKLKNLKCLSLRDNPLVHHFVRSMSFTPPSLRELSARVIKQYGIKFEDKGVLPIRVADYLHQAKQCLNPKCEGVYFQTFVENVKFVDFCGKFQVPLMQYLCSPACSHEQTPKSTRRPTALHAVVAEPSDSSTSSSSTETEQADDAVQRQRVSQRMRRVLLG